MVAIPDNDIDFMDHIEDQADAVKEQRPPDPLANTDMPCDSRKGMDESTLTTFLECSLSKAPDGTKAKWETTTSLFVGRTPEQAIMSLCRASPTAGHSMIEGFTNQQSKKDKPKFKKILKECTS
ncbi:uncharacterized protein LOC135369390 [Ornithodoros turicata]|uniref:uncharacterized protein LOC135369390 n=1 Tax=Ornithodoros turicata TaxID=34597 RepID=UPI003138ADFB